MKKKCDCLQPGCPSCDSDGLKIKLQTELSSRYIIENISKRRHEFVNEREDSWDERAMEYGVTHEAIIDKLGDEILDTIERDFDLLPFDFIIIELTKLGQAPSLIYDDNGNFAISGSSFQSVSSKDYPEDLEAVMFIKAEDFKDTPKEALRQYVFIQLKQ